MITKLKNRINNESFNQLSEVAKKVFKETILFSRSDISTLQENYINELKTFNFFKIDTYVCKNTNKVYKWINLVY